MRWQITATLFAWGLILFWGFFLCFLLAHENLRKFPAHQTISTFLWFVGGGVLVLLLLGFLGFLISGKILQPLVELTKSLSPEGPQGEIADKPSPVLEVKRLRESFLSALSKERERIARLQKRNRRLKKTNRHLTRRNQNKTHFVAAMSHELRNPLHTALGFLDLLQDECYGPLSPPQKRCVGEVLENSNYLLKLIENILDLSKVEAGKSNILPENFLLHDFLGEMLHVVQALAIKKTIRLTVSTEGEIPLMYADKMKLKQILYNLLTNAIAYTPYHGEINLKSRSVGGEAEILVSDTGIGIARADQARIFGAFHRVHNIENETRRGAGLGLYLTRQLVEMQKGTIRVQSEPGKGSLFTIRLPICFRAEVEDSGKPAMTDSGPNSKQEGKDVCNRSGEEDLPQRRRDTEIKKLADINETTDRTN